jgi:hypothetical protein
MKVLPKRFLTLTLDVVKDQLHARVTLRLAAEPPASIEQEDVWTPKPIRTLCKKDKYLAAFGIRNTINRAFML